MNQELLSRIKEVYSDLSLETLPNLELLYDEDVVFIDPANTITGRKQLFEHFRESYENVSDCVFDFDDSMELVTPDGVFLSWKMSIKHKKLNGNKPINVSGASFLKITDGIIFHRDWFDLGEMIYENIPLLGSAVGFVKNKLKSGSH